LIPDFFIDEWRREAPWTTSRMVEQDLIICRAVVEIFSDPQLASALAFRGGTALHKLHLPPATRYSEDIDLVQMQDGPIGPVFDALRGRLEPWLGKPRRDFGPGVVAMTFKMTSEGSPPEPMRLKVEINSREHFTELGLERRPFAVESRWFQGTCEIPTFALDEMLGSKLRALYQRRKGRDLFDLWLGLTRGRADPARVVPCFRRFLQASGTTVSVAEFRQNLERKLGDRVFRDDLGPLLPPDVAYDVEAACRLVLAELVDRLG
jgi:predicted nucleotidyltransferase component of viral defense system